MNLGEPDFVNEEGFRWYRPDLFKDRAAGVGVHVFLVCDGGDRPQGYVAIDGKTNEVVADNPQLEGMAVFLDMLRAQRDFA